MQRQLPKQLFLLASFFFLSFQLGKAQEAYTNCFNPFTITNPSNYCSSDGFFTNVDVSTSPYGAASCWDNNEADVWFSFIATATAVNILVDGSFPGNSLGSPQVALYDNNCGGVISEFECGADNVGQDVVSIYQGGLSVGQTYLIRVNGYNGLQGTFQLCVNNYNPPVEPGQDCITGSLLCDKTSFVVQSVTGAGNQTDEAAGTCLGPLGLNSLLMLLAEGLF